jgi:hypothetical protein
MLDEKKSPVSIQLVGLTAVLVFCYSTIGSFNLAQALWLKQEPIASLEVSNQIEFYAPLIIFAIICGASLYTFLTLLFRTVRNAALISIAYLILLLLFLTLQLTSAFLAYFALHTPLQTFAVWLGVKFVYAAWLIGLLVKVWPNYSLK